MGCVFGGVRHPQHLPGDAGCDGAGDEEAAEQRERREDEEDERREREMDASSMETAGYAPEEIERVTGINLPENEEELATNAARRFYYRDRKGRFNALGFHRKGSRSSKGKKLLGKTGSPNLIEAGDSKRKTKRALVKAFDKAKDGKKVSTGYKMGSHEVTLAPGDKEHWGRDHAERKEHPGKISSDKLAEMTMHSPRKNERANTVTIKDGDNVLVYAPENQPAIPSGGKVNRKQKGKPVVGKNWYRTGDK